MDQPLEISRLAAELARYRSSAKSVEQVIYELYRSGQLKPIGIRDGKVVWVSEKGSQ